MAGDNKYAKCQRSLHLSWMGLVLLDWCIYFPPLYCQLWTWVLQPVCLSALRWTSLAWLILNNSLWFPCGFAPFHRVPPKWPCVSCSSPGHDFWQTKVLNHILPPWHRSTVIKSCSPSQVSRSMSCSWWWRLISVYLALSTDTLLLLLWSVL